METLFPYKKIQKNLEISSLGKQKTCRDMMAKDNLSLIPDFFLQAGMFLSNQNSTHVPPTTASDTAVVQRSVDPYNLM